MDDEHQRMADEHLEEADRIQEVSDNLGEDIKNTRDDWQSKKQTESVPGAIKTQQEIADENYEPPNEFEFEKRTPETAEAQGPAAVGDSDEEDDDS